MIGRCSVCMAAVAETAPDCDHGALVVLEQIARYDPSTGVAASDVARLTGVPLSTLSQVLLGDSVRGSSGRLLDDGLVERFRIGLATRYRLTHEGVALLAV